jgi:hypothetical protein
MVLRGAEPKTIVCPTVFPQKQNVRLTRKMSPHLSVEIMLDVRKYNYKGNMRVLNPPKMSALLFVYQGIKMHKVHKNKMAAFGVRSHSHLSVQSMLEVRRYNCKVNLRLLIPKQVLCPTKNIEPSKCLLRKTLGQRDHLHNKWYAWLHRNLSQYGWFVEYNNL